MNTLLRTKITSLLKNITTYSVYYMNAPLNTGYPFITYNIINSNHSIDTECKYEEVMLQINIFHTEFNLSDVENKIALIHLHFDNADLTLTTDEYYCVGVYRDFTRMLKNIDENKKTYWQGVIQYRLSMQQK